MLIRHVDLHDNYSKYANIVENIRAKKLYRYAWAPGVADCYWLKLIFERVLIDTVRNLCDHLAKILIINQARNLKKFPYETERKL